MYALAYRSQEQIQEKTCAAVRDCVNYTYVTNQIESTGLP